MFKDLQVYLQIIIKDLDQDHQRSWSGNFRLFKNLFKTFLPGSSKILAKIFQDLQRYCLKNLSRSLKILEGTCEDHYKIFYLTIFSMILSRFEQTNIQNNRVKKYESNQKVSFAR